MFVGEIEIQTFCKECKKVKKRSDPFYSLNIRFPDIIKEKETFNLVDLLKSTWK
jgi:hypothetical protein